MKWTEETAPDYFIAKFETTKGAFEVESKKEWSPEGVDRLYQLIKNGYYTDIGIFRVVPGYVAQFGIHNDSTVTAAWRKVKLIDEPVVEQNTKGAMSFARGGPKSRTTQLFVNLENHGYAPRFKFH